MRGIVQLAHGLCRLQWRPLKIRTMALGLIFPTWKSKPLAQRLVLLICVQLALALHVGIITVITTRSALDLLISPISLHF